MESQLTWPGWSIVRLLGKGSFGSVYEIQRDVFGTIEKAALKVITIPQDDTDIESLRDEGYDEESITQRYQSYLEDIVKEYSLMAELKGISNIVDCDDLQYSPHKDGFGWDILIKMELLTPLMKTLGKEISEEQVIGLGIDICEALVICKSRNIVHRDIKPQNIFVSKYGRYKLGDFGIAKIAERTTQGTKTGTFKYMAPEVYNNQPYGATADIYSLGILMYWMLNRKRTPFLPLPPKMPTGLIEDEARQKRFNGEQIPPPIDGSDELKRIVLKACAFDPSDRFSSAQEMLDELKAISKSEATIYEQREPKKSVNEQNITPQQADEKHSEQHTDQPGELRSTKVENDTSALSLKPALVGEEGTQNAASLRGKPGLQFKLDRKGKLVAVILLCTFIIVATALLILIFNANWSKSARPSYPSERVMQSDMASVVKGDGITGSLTDVQLLSAEENEKYGTYSVEYLVSVNANEGTKKYHVTLIYEEEGGTWLLSNLNKVYEVIK